MEIENIMDIRGAGKWALLVAAYLLLNVIYLSGRWEFWYAIPYIVGFASIAIASSERKPKFIQGLCAALIGLLSVAVSNGFIEAGLIVIVSVALFMVLLLNETGLLRFKTSPISPNLLLLLAVFSWALFSITYFGIRLTRGMPLPVGTILNHGAIILLSLNECLRLLNVKYEYQDMIGVASALLACLGAYLLVAELGWGLSVL